MRSRVLAQQLGCIAPGLARAEEQEAGSEEAAVEIVPDGDEAFGKAKESLELTFPDRGSKPAVKKVKEA